MPIVDFQTAQSRNYDLVVVGSGPAGLALALSAASLGLRLLIVEQGGRQPSDPGIPSGFVLDPQRHVGPETASCQALGGTFHWWGGRSVPLDPEDFSPALEPCWPIAYSDFATWIPKASAFLGVEPAYTWAAPPGWEAVPGVSATQVEILCSDRSLNEARIGEALAATDILLDTAVKTLDYDPSTRDVTSILVQTSGQDQVLPARSLALCCGGLEATRLLLGLQEQHPALAGGQGGPLGQVYMGHLTGVSGTIRLNRPEDGRAFAYQGQPRPSRRRLMLTTSQGNQPPKSGIAFWLENIDADDPAHGVGVLSLKYLVLWLTGQTVSRKMNVMAHLANIAMMPLSTLQEVATLILRRLTPDDRPADRLRYSRHGAYNLAYHAEHLPNPDSRVSLGTRRDPLGRRMLEIDFRFREDDFQAIAGSYRSLKQRLETAGVAKVEFDEASLVDSIAAQASDGYHQIGLTRMAGGNAASVVDRDLKVQGTENLYTVSAAIFPRSGQANPTLSIVCFAIRLAEHLVQSKR